MQYYHYNRGLCGITKFKLSCSLHFDTISGQVDEASATEAVDPVSIPGRVKPKTWKIDIHSFLA